MSIEQKIDNIPTQIENMILKNNETITSFINEKQRDSNIKLQWFIGTGIAIASVLVPVLLHFWK